MHRLAHIALAAVMATSCASGGSSDPSTRPERTRSGANVLTQEDLARTEAPTALQVVQQLRPAWLRSRGDFSASPSSRPADIIVYVDDVRFGTWRDLEQVSRNSIREMRYYSATEATTRWGTGHSLGAIVVITAR
jgi:hypothetical protein